MPTWNTRPAHVAAGCPEGRAFVNAAEKLVTLPLLPMDRSELIAIEAGSVSATVIPQAALAGFAGMVKKLWPTLPFESKPWPERR